jgi:hypothetical protein
MGQRNQQQIHCALGQTVPPHDVDYAQWSTADFTTMTAAAVTPNPRHTLQLPAYSLLDAACACAWLSSAAGFLQQQVLTSTSLHTSRLGLLPALACFSCCGLPCPPTQPVLS